MLKMVRRIDDLDNSVASSGTAQLNWRWACNQIKEAVQTHCSQKDQLFV